MLTLSKKLKDSLKSAVSRKTLVFFGVKDLKKALLYRGRVIDISLEPTPNSSQEEPQDRVSIIYNRKERDAHLDPGLRIRTFFDGSGLEKFSPDPECTLAI